METPYLIKKASCLYSQNDITESFSGNIDDSLIIKENNLFKDNILFKSNTEIFDKQLNNIKFCRFIKDDEDEKNIYDSLNNEKETKTNYKNIFSNNSIKVTDDELKIQLKLKRNRESARKGRLRKKEFIQNLIKENNYLKSN